MSFTKVNAAGIGTTQPLTLSGVNLTGIVTASGLYVTGVSTFTSNVSIAGTLTYEDVTNVDSVGLITARNGIKITGGSGLDLTGSLGIITATTYKVGAAVTISSGGVEVVGVTTTQVLKVGTAGTTLSTTSVGDVNISGKLGIGIASPGKKLDVSDGTVTGGLDPFSGGSVLTLGTSTNHSLRFDVNGAERARIDTSGRLLVGTTTSMSAGSQAQYAKFQIIGSTASATGQGIISIGRGQAASAITANSDVGYINFTDNAGNEFAQIGCYTDATPGSSDYPGRLTFATTADGASSPTERARIDSSGRLLIGTSTSPSLGNAQYSKLQVQGYVGNNAGAGDISISRGQAASSGLSAGAGIGAISFTDSTGYGFAQIYCEVDGATGANDYPGRLTFYTCPDGSPTLAERMRITSAGFTKHKSGSSNYYNATGPYHEIQTDSSNNILIMSNYGTTPYGPYIYYSTTPNNTGSDFLYCTDSTTARFTVRSNGGIANYSGNNVNLCDEREKKNIVNLDSTWDCLKHWELKKFHYNEDADTEDLRYGVIAQQVADYCPEVISEWVKQRAEPAKLDDEGNEIEPAKEEILRMAVKEQQMMWMAIKALQEAQTRIETLEAEVAALKGA